MSRKSCPIFMVDSPVVEEERETAGVAAGKPGYVLPTLPDMKIIVFFAASL